MNAYGSGQRRLAPAHPGMRWSPDGQKIVFDQDDEIWIMNADGSGQERLTSDPGLDSGLAWLPDGRAIAFARSPPPWPGRYSEILRHERRRQRAAEAHATRLVTSLVARLAENHLPER